MKTLKLIFNTSTGKKATISLKNCKSDLTGADIKAVMDTIIAKDVFVTKQGTLISVDSSYVDESVQSEIALA